MPSERMGQWRIISTRVNGAHAVKRNVFIIGIILIAAIAAGGWYLTAKNHKPATSTSTKAAHHYPWNSSNLQTASANPQATNAVTIQNFIFMPAAITVKKGTT